MSKPIELYDNGFHAKVILASVGSNGIPIYSIEAKYPRFIHSELMTHRDRARNAASSRAIPWKRFTKEYQHYTRDDLAPLDAYVKNCMYSMIMTEPVVPISFGLEQKGMQSGDELTGEKRDQAINIWLLARNAAIIYADELSKLGVHKSICNRLTEPFMWITTLFTATEWENFFRLRCHEAAEKHFQKIAGMMREVKNNAEPRSLSSGQWHLPYVTKMTDDPLYWQGEEGIAIHNAVQKGELGITDTERVSGKSWMQIGTERIKRISAGRSARLSYLTHEGKRDWNEDLKLFSTLIERTDNVIHASPLEHVNESSSRTDLRSGPMRGWKQFRKEFSLENVEG
jgi:hypothetical protein